MVEFYLLNFLSSGGWLAIGVLIGGSILFIGRGKVKKDAIKSLLKEVKDFDPELKIKIK